MCTDWGDEAQPSSGSEADGYGARTAVLGRTGLSIVEVGSGIRETSAFIITISPDLFLYQEDRANQVNEVIHV